MNTPNITEDTPLYSSRIVDTYIKLLKRNYNHINVSELLRAAKMTSYEVADEAHWFTQTQINLFHEKLSQFTQNENIAREAGRYAASPDAIGVMRQYVLGMVSPAKVFELIHKGAQKFSRSSSYNSKKLASNKFEITVTPLKGAASKSLFNVKTAMAFLRPLR